MYPASIHYGQSNDFKTHQLFYEKNIVVFENLTNLNSLPATSTYVIALPMKIKGGSGEPLSMIAWVTKKELRAESTLQQSTLLLLYRFFQILFYPVPYNFCNECNRHGLIEWKLHSTFGTFIDR